MIKQAIQFISATILGFGLVVGCGAQDDMSDDTSGLNGAPFVDPIGQAQEAISSSVSTDSTLSPIVGYVNSTGHTRCFTSTTGTCLVPNRKTWTICTHGVSAVAQTAFVNEAFELRQGTGLVINTNSAASCVLAAGNIVATTGAVAGATDANINNYVTSNFLDSGATLSESLPGSYASHGAAGIVLDETKLASLGGTAAIQNNRRAQTVILALSQLVGLGETACGSGASHPCTCAGFADGETNRVPLAVQKCLLTNYNVSSPTTFSVTGTNCGTWPAGI